MATKLDVSKNDAEGLQVQWHGILLTLKVNTHHGLSGSLAEMDGDKVRLLNFHGQTPKQFFPAAFHEDAMDSGRPLERPVFKAYQALTDIRLEMPDQRSPEEDDQMEVILDLQDKLWRLLTPEEIEKLDEETE